MANTINKTQGGNVQLPDGTTGYFKSQFLVDSKGNSISDGIYYGQDEKEKYKISFEKEKHGRYLLFHNCDVNKDFPVPLSKQIEDYGITFISDVIEPLVVENKGLTMIITFSVNSSTQLQKYQPNKLVKMNKVYSLAGVSGKNIATVFSAILKFEKLRYQKEQKYFVVPVCYAIKKQSSTEGLFVSDMGGNGGGERSVPPVALAIYKNGSLSEIKDIETGEKISTDLEVIIPSLSTGLIDSASDASFTTLIYRGKVQVMQKFEQ